MTKRNILVLGINDGHDAGAALVKNGLTMAAVQEERLNNTKHFTGIPEKSIVEVFRISKADPSDVNLICLVSFDPPGMENLKSLSTRALIRLSPLLHSDRYIKFYTNFKRKRRTFAHLRKIFERLKLLDTETTVIEHQTAHAACAYRTSPWGYNGKDKDGILILTADGSGDGLSSTVNTGRDSRIQRIAFSSYYDSVGNAFYTEITRFLGLKPWDHEYKVMGLAPYGRAEYCIEQMKKIIRVHPHNPLRFENTVGTIRSSTIQSKLRKLLVNQRFDNVAAAAQQHFEDLMKRWVQNAIRSTGIHKVACSGGLFLNVKANKILGELQEVDDIFFYPASDDEGTPIGAALQGYYEYSAREGIRPEHVPVGEIYYGPSYSNDEIKEILDLATNNNEKKWKYDYYDDIDGTTGELLVKGKILARSTGGLEWGPRALGNRSIIADPRNTRVVNKINFAIKQRDFWMPFAPSILDERKADYLVEAEFAPYMIKAFDSTLQGGGKIPATIHPFDRTCRPQTVRKEWNQNYYKIIKTFESYTGEGAILNTSFNLHGYPMVGTPQTALWTLENSKLDGLVLGNYLITKNN
ncbi:MAG: carbamoyltransferase C-terminal domain-containing protein [Nitrososphaeraceae archaeon]